MGSNPISAPRLTGHSKSGALYFSLDILPFLPYPTPMRTLLLLLLVLSDSLPTEDFIPKDIDKSVMVGCFVDGADGRTAEAVVVVQYIPGKGPMDYRAVIARRSVETGGTLRAIEDCQEWYRGVKRKFTKGEGK